MTVNSSESRSNGNGRTDDHSLTIDAPERTLGSERIGIRITGVEPNRRVTFEASMRDPRGATWSSETTFVADDDGVVDLTERAPVSGSYEGVRPMGWLSSMESDATPEPFIYPSNTDTRSIELRATSGTHCDERTIEGLITPPEVQETPIETDTLVGTLYEPSGTGTRPGVLVLHGAGGAPLKRPASLLAAHGYAALAIKFTGNEAILPDRLERIDVSYFDTAATWLREREGVGGDSIGVLGWGRTGELALLLGSQLDWPGVVVSFNGSGVAWDTLGGEPSWLVEDDPVPHLCGKKVDGPPPQTEEGYYYIRPLLEEPLEEANETALREATIPVEETDAPILLVSGGDDQFWPSERLSQIAAERLDRHEYEHDFGHLVYDDVGHSFVPPYLPTTGRRIAGKRLYGGTARGYALAEADAWPTVLDYLERGLDPNETDY